MLHLALAFVLTVLLEWPVLALLSRLSFRQTGLFCLCMNGATWGTAMGVLDRWAVPVPALEGGIVLVEAAILAWFWRWRPPRALGMSLAMNLVSWLLGTPLLFFLAPAA
jgi:hypothetical protein